VAEEKNWLHLFSSNIRELYVADTIDLLAAPKGFIYQFRYQEEYVQDAAASRWNGRAASDGGLQGASVITYFSLQHSANFHPAAYVPLRYGKVVDAYSEGNTFIVLFELLDYAPLRDPQKDGGHDAIVQNFSNKIREMLSPSYPDFADNEGKAQPERRSATMGTSPEGLIDAVGDEGDKFERVARYMSDALGPQQARLFFRVSSIWKGNAKSPETLTKQGYLEIVAGNHYRIDVAHYQPSGSPADGSVLHVGTPTGLDLLTPAEMPLRSRYDVMQVRLFAPFRDDELQGELTIRVKEPARGASFRVPVRIAPSATHSVAYPTFAIVGAFCALVPAIIGTSSDLTVRLGFTGAGAILLGFGAWARKSKGLAG